MRLRWWALLVPVMVIACGRSDESGDLPPRQWGKIGVTVETRPVPPAAGMNELLVMASDNRGRPVWDMVVSLRTRPEDVWRQAIQDGESGVYRRALALSPGPQTLYVELKRAGDKTVLEYSLVVH